MPVSRRKAQDYAEELLSRPRGRLAVSVYHGRSGVTLRCGGRTIARCNSCTKGLMAAAFMAQALGADLPPVGETVEAEVSTGVLYRAVAIAALDVRTPEGRMLLERHLSEAREMLGLGEGV